MALERPTPTDIYKRIKADMESRITGSVSILRRALLDVLAIVLAGIMHILYGVLDLLSINVLPDTTDEYWLTRHGNMWGVTRKGASFAEGTITFGGVNGTLIPAGTLVQYTPTGFEYETLANATITSGSASPTIRAVDAGADPNLLAAPFTVYELTLVSPITGCDDSGFTGEVSGGNDEETLDEWRDRILERIQFPPSGGNAADYIRWAKEVDGVEDAWTFPLFAGAGTVSVVIKPADSSLASTVQTYIDTKKPLTANEYLSTYVFPITESGISFNISIDENTAANQTAITEAIEKLFNDEGVPGGTILISHVRTAIASTGIYDYNITAIYKGITSLPIDDIDFTDYEYPVIDVMNYSTL